MSRLLLLCLVVALGCKRREEVKSDPEPSKLRPFSAEVDGAKRTFAFGHAFVVGRRLDVLLMTTQTECPTQFPTNAYTASFKVPAGHDAKFFAGTLIEVDVSIRQALGEPSWHRGAVLRVASVADGHARGHLELPIGGGDFDVSLCSPNDLTQIEIAPERTLGDHVEGTFDGQPFRHERAFIFQDVTLVLTDNASITCADLAPASCPAASPKRIPGRTIEVFAYRGVPTEALHPARGSLVTMTPTASGSHAIVFNTPNDLSVRPTSATAGVLVGFTSSDRLDVAGSFEATVCPLLCQ